MHRGQPSVFRDCFPIGRSLSEAPPPWPSTARFLVEFSCPCRQSGTNSALLPIQDLPMCFCTPCDNLPLQGSELQQEQPVAGEEGRRRRCLSQRNEVSELIQA